MTTDICIMHCRQAGYNTPFAGLQGGTRCICLDGNFQQVDSVDDSECNQLCGGDKNDICGGENTLSIYNVTLGYCSDPQVFSNGLITQDTSYEFGSVVRFACEPGFSLIGSPSIQCVLGNMPNQLVWNTTTPVCEEIPPSSNTETSSLPMTTMITEGVPTTGTLSLEIIIGAAIGGLIVILLVILILVVLCYKRKNTKESDVNEGNEQGGISHNNKAFDNVTEEESHYSSIDEPGKDKISSYYTYLSPKYGNSGVLEIR
ncbi:uncharacterized protein [Amphiura filiformis]|uniref:uncharacterized protein n=1 Tax=Amphiura filiformis TaxID=82378 RepID=UPI003B2157F3